LREWKALPLLLEALAKCPGDLRYQLRVMGVGSSQRRWQQLAQRLGVAAHIEWVGWPSYQESLAHYAWADAFAFTSLRDTSGTGLLESLAAGTPIIGVDHQGAHDIMTAACALPVAVANPSTTIAGFATAISQLASDPVMWQRLSRGARKRAEFYSWHRLSNELNRYYAKILVTRASHVSSVAAGELARSVSHNDGTSTLLAR
jgi:glycosyltransferase involved in cell wall biosynthesis